MVYIIGLTIACFLILLLFYKKEKRVADYLLVAWMVTMIVHLGLSYMQYTGAAYQYPHLLGLTLPLPLLHGLFLYAYASEQTGTSILKSKAFFLHLLPFLFLVVLGVPFYSLPAYRKIEVFQNEGQGFEWYTLIQRILISLSGLAYAAATLLKIKQYRKNLLNYFSNTEKKKLEWIAWSATGLAVIWVMAAFFDDPVIFGGVALFVLFIGVSGIHQAPVFYSDIAFEPGETADLLSEPEKYARTGLENEEVRKIMNRLETLMQEEKPYTNSELTLKELASMLPCSPNHLSQAINSGYGKTFYHYINSYRIREFLEMIALPENKKFTFLALAYDAGFNSKTTFNKYFKLETGKTPSEYFDAFG